MRRTWKTDIGMAVLIASTYVFMATFMIAYFNTKTPYTATISINAVGEAHLEFLAIIFSTPFILLTIIEYKRTKRTRNYVYLPKVWKKPKT